MVDQARSMKEARALKGTRERTEAREKVEAAKAATSEVVKRATWDEASDNTIIDMLKMGKLWPEIGCALGRPYSSCYTRYYTVLDPALKEPWSHEIVDQLNEKVAQGVPWKQIAKDLNMRPVTLRAKWIALNRSNAAVTSGELNNREATSTIKSKSGVKWISFSKEESTQIMDLVEKHGQENWDRIHHDFQEHFLQDEPVSSSLSFSSNSVSLKRARQRIRNITPDNLRYQYSRISRNLRSWTFDQETVLIQQVIKFGTEGHWDEIARLSGFHTPAECRSHWKQLDMPVNNLNSMAWRLTEQTTFWDLWKTVGSDFERISKLSGGLRSPEECQRYFESTTRDFPDLETNRTEFERQVEQLRETLPASRQRYIFTKQRSLRLQRIMKYYGRHGNKWAMRGTWDLVAQRFQRGLPATTCIEHWLYLNKNMDLIHGPLEQGKSTIKPEISSSWSHEELKLLDQGIRELGSSWSDIQQSYLPWRTTRSIRQRWMLMSDKSTKVTEEEYYTIVAAGTVSSEIDYRSLAKKMPGWKLSPCKRVFETSYKHILSNTVWLPEEDQLLIEKTLEIKGHDWNAIAKHFDGVETARSPLYDSAVSALGYRDKMPMRTRKSGWQCRLRWCQLVEPLMPNERVWPVSGRSLTLKLSKQLLGKIQTTT
ncbi:hypothetical protein BGZ49_008609 [Haplosporangium sp. Z 27]|nr:hypothetical protein BGZ49_008609 [Haplosporangium sp. Z 27]